MFGMSWTQIILIVVIGVFLLGPERIPTAVQWATGSLKKMRGMAQGAQQQLNSELGPEIAEMRRQIAELQGLKEMQSLKELRDLNPRSMITKTIFGTDEARTSGGVAGLLGLDPELLSDPGSKKVSAGGPAEVTARAAEQNAVSFDKAAASPGPTVSDPLPLVGGAQELLEPASQPDPMPEINGSEQHPEPVSEPGTTSAADPLPPTGGSSDPLPQVGGSSDPLPRVGASSDPLPSIAATAPAVASPAAEPVPAESTPAGSTPAEAPAARPAPVPPARDQRPLVAGGDPLPRIAAPDPLPAVGP